MLFNLLLQRIDFDRKNNMIRLTIDESFIIIRINIDWYRNNIETKRFKSVSFSIKQIILSIFALLSICITYCIYIYYVNYVHTINVL